MINYCSCQDLVSVLTVVFVVLFCSFCSKTFQFFLKKTFQNLPNVSNFTAFLTSERPLKFNHQLIYKSIAFRSSSYPLLFLFFFFFFFSISKVLVILYLLYLFILAFYIQLNNNVQGCRNRSWYHLLLCGPLYQR